jgi:hypothetical protein
VKEKGETNADINVHTKILINGDGANALDSGSQMSLSSDEQDILERFGKSIIPSITIEKEGAVGLLQN